MKVNKLICKNKFGNKNRFTDENGLQQYNNNLIWDNATGLEYIIKDTTRINQAMAEIINDPFPRCWKP